MFDVFWEDEDGTLKFQHHHNKVYAHATVNVWNKRVYMKCLDVWHVAKEELKELGYAEVYVLIPFDDVKLRKFETIFGFKPVKQIHNALLMVCSTEK